MSDDCFTSLTFSVDDARITWLNKPLDRLMKRLGGARFNVLHLRNVLRAQPNASLACTLEIWAHNQQIDKSQRYDVQCESNPALRCSMESIS